MAVRTRKRGKTYSYIFEAGKTADGKRKVIEKGGFPTADEAYDAGIAAYVDWKHGNIGITAERMLFTDMVELWMKANASNICGNTKRTYASHIANNIGPYFKGMTIQDITPRDIEGWVLEMCNKGFSATYIKTMLSVIKSTFKYAVYPCELIKSSPAVYTKIPKSCPRNIVKRSVITPEQFDEIIAKEPSDSPYIVPMLIAYHTGMRLGEVLGLTWDCVDLDSNMVEIRQQIQFFSKSGYCLTSPKTESSCRNIPIPEELSDKLAEWKMLQDINKEVLGDAYVVCYKKGGNGLGFGSQSLLTDNPEMVNLVCTCENGRPVLRTSLAAHLKNIGLNSHSFRHTHATLLIESGATPKGVASRLGHANVQITQDLYTHDTEKLKQATLDIYKQRISKSHS